MCQQSKKTKNKQKKVQIWQSKNKQKKMNKTKQNGGWKKLRQQSVDCNVTAPFLYYVCYFTACVGIVIQMLFSVLYCAFGTIGSAVMLGLLSEDARTRLQGLDLQNPTQFRQGMQRILRGASANTIQQLPTRKYVSKKNNVNPTRAIKFCLLCFF